MVLLKLLSYRSPAYLVKMGLIGGIEDGEGGSHRGIQEVEFLLGQEPVNDGQDPLLRVLLGELLHQVEQPLEEVIHNLLIFPDLQRLLIGNQPTLERTEFPAHDCLFDRFEEGLLLADVLVPYLDLLE